MPGRVPSLAARRACFAGATPQVMQNILPGFLAEYRRSRPGIEIELIEEGGARLLNLVEQGALRGDERHSVGNATRAAIAVSHTRAGRDWLRAEMEAPIEIDVRQLVNEPLLLLRQDFGSRQLFDAACRIAHIQPRIVLESAEPNSLIALAEAGHGIAVVPSTVRLASQRIRLIPILVKGKSLGTWGSIVWDARRALPIYAASFIEELTTYAQRSFPGKRFDRIAPPVPTPPDQRA